MDAILKVVAPFSGAIVTVILFSVAALIGIGKAKATMATKNELSETVKKTATDCEKKFFDLCKANRSGCQNEVALRVAGVHTAIAGIDRRMSESQKVIGEQISGIFVRINAMDEKREEAKDVSNKRIDELSRSIGRLEGLIKNKVNGNGFGG